jgi:UDP-4-amino-4,6-dideoxy-N-acetyl-beta-L-altrosamine transaminase
LHVACMALDVGPGDRVWTTPITFVASANCARYCGAIVDFVDIDPATWNLSPVELEAKLERAARTGNLPKVVIPVHFTGEPCDMAAIHALGQRYGFHIIEDASHAIGARYQGNPVGSCQYSDITVFSFHPVKIITTAEGGMAMTNTPHIATRMAQLRTHGITRVTEEMTVEPHGPWYYEQFDLGYNYRMTDLQAALGLSQLQRLDEFTQVRHDLARRYDIELRELPIGLPVRDPAHFSALHLYTVQVSQRAAVYRAMQSAGVGVNVHYIPVHTQPYYRRLGFKPGDFPASESYYDAAISLPLFPSMTTEQQDHVIETLARTLR